MRADVLVPAGPVHPDGKAVYPPVLPRGPLLAAQRLTELGYESRVVDCYSFPDLQDTIVSEIGRTADLVGISVHGSPSLEPAIKLAERLRRARTDLPIIFGGNLAQAAPEILLPYLPRRSAVVSGASKETLAAGIMHVTGADEPPRVFATAQVRPANDEDWRAYLGSLFRPLSAYLADPDFEYHLPTQDGCPFRCFHCGTGRRGLFARVNYRVIDSIAEELNILGEASREAGMERPRVWITDETFLSSRTHAEAVAEMFEAQPVGWKWRVQTRLDCIDDEILRRMGGAGCYKIAFGIEIPSDAGLQLLGKREEMNAAAQAFASARKANIDPEAIVVLGTPGDDSSLITVSETLSALGAKSVQSYIYHPVPGSPWWRQFGGSATRSVDWWSRLDFHSKPIATYGKSAATIIGEYLALQLWLPLDEVTSSLPALPPAAQCGRCGTLATVAIVANTSSTLSVQLAVNGSTSIAAWNVSTGEVLSVDAAAGGNIHQAVRASEDRVTTIGDLVTSACPICLAERAA